MRIPAAPRRLDPSRRFPVRLGGAAAGLLLVAVAGSLVVLAVAAQWSPLLRWDNRVAESVQQATLTHAALRTSATAITHLGDTLTRAAVTVAAVAMLVRRGAFRSAIFLATVVPLGALILTLTKLAVDRARPVLPEPITTAGGASFPSGHAMGSMVTYGALLLVALPFLPASARRLARWATAAVVLAVGSSRVMLGVHFPSDVLGGWLLGLAWLLLTRVLFDRWGVETGRLATGRLATGRLATGKERIEDPTLTGIEPEEAGHG